MIVGSYFDGVTAEARQVEVQFTADALRLVSPDFVLEMPYSELSVTEPLGRTVRSVTFPSGARLDVPDVAELNRFAPKDTFHWVDFLERRWRYVFAAVVLVIGVSWVLIQFGTPIFAQAVASRMPPSIDEAISVQGLSLLDRAILEPSELSSTRQAALTRSFQEIARHSADGHAFTLEFRAGGPIGANAFALPSGTIIITDELIELAENDEEIIGVLAHEVGHVVNRHSIRLLLQSSSTALLIAAFTGDVTSLSALAASIPTVLVQSSYSRNFEREADAYAYGYLDDALIPAHHLSDLLLRLQEASGQGDGRLEGYLSTHPPAAERAEGGNE